MDSSERQWIRENSLIRFENSVHKQRKNQLLKLVNIEYDLLKMIEDSDHFLSDRKEEMRKNCLRRITELQFRLLKMEGPSNPFK